MLTATLIVRHGLSSAIPVLAMGEIGFTTDTNQFYIGTGSVNILIGPSTGGTVTSVGLSLPSIFSVTGSPVTGSGTLTATLANETANTIFAGPSSGSAAAPTFRSLVGTDLPVASTSSRGAIESDGVTTLMGSNNALTSKLLWANFCTTTTLPAYTYSNGSSGVGATITASSNGVLSIDSQPVSAGQRVVIGNEVAGNGPNNGLYDVTQAGDASHPFILTRSPLMQYANQFYPAAVLIAGGTINTGVIVWNISSMTTIGTSNVQFVGTTVTQSMSALIANAVSGGAAGDVLYQSATGTTSFVAPNSTGTKKFLNQTSSGAPAWGQPAFSDISGSVAASQLPNPSASTLGGIQSVISASHQWIDSISTSGVPHQSQPAFSDISGSVAASQLPNPGLSTLGGIEAINAVTSKWINAINTSGVPQLTQPAFSDISGSVAASQLPNPSASTLGGIQSAAAVSSQWINSISTSGVPSLSQPAFSDISGTAASSQIPCPLFAKGLVLVSGTTPTLQAGAFNVTSGNVTRSATGVYSVVYTTSITSAIPVLGNCSNNAAVARLSSVSSSGFTANFSNLAGTAVDPTGFSFVVG